MALARVGIFVVECFMGDGCSGDTACHQVLMLAFTLALAPATTTATAATALAASGTGRFLIVGFAGTGRSDERFHRQLLLLAGGFGNRGIRGDRFARWLFTIALRLRGGAAGWLLAAFALRTLWLILPGGLLCLRFARIAWFVACAVLAWRVTARTATLLLWPRGSRAAIACFTRVTATLLASCGRRLGGLRGRLACKQAAKPGHETTGRFGCRRCGGGRCHGFDRLDRGRTGRNDAADGRLLGLVLDLCQLRQGRACHRRQALVTRLGVFADVGGADALDVQVRGFQLVVGDDDDLDFLAHFDLAELAALFIDEEVGNFRRRLHQHLSGVLLHRVFFNQAQGRQRQ